MNIIRPKFKFIFLVLLCMISALFLTKKIVNLVPYGAIIEELFGDDAAAPCNKKIRWLDNKQWPVIGLVGPPGSGVVWLRYLIEQMTGLYTGSVIEEDQPHDVFKRTFTIVDKGKKYVVIMAYDLDDLPPVTAAIVVYRSMEDTVRSQFSKQQGIGAFLEAPLESFYGKEWQMFSWTEASSWTQRYQVYLDSNIPLLIVRFDELNDPDQIQRKLLHISHFLHVPIRHNVLECLAERANDFYELKPRSLRYGFRPFELLSAELRDHFERLENITETRIGKAQDNYLPKIHV